jgi:hypothetical protein
LCESEAKKARHGFRPLAVRGTWVITPCGIALKTRAVVGYAGFLYRLPLGRRRLVLPKTPHGHVAEWLRSGLQNRLPRFNSGRGLQVLIPERTASHRNAARGSDSFPGPGEQYTTPRKPVASAEDPRPEQNLTGR